MTFKHLVLSDRPKEETALAQINQAKALLDKAESLEQVLDIRAVADSVATLARAKGADEAHLKALEIKIRAERKAGEFVEKIPREKPPGVTKDRDQAGTYLQEVKKEYGKGTVQRWSELAKIPEPQFETLVTNSAKVAQSAILSKAREIQKEVERESPPPTSVENSKVFIVKGDFQFSDVTNSSIQAIVTDPPYGEVFDNWTGLASFANRVLKPGGWFLAYSGQAKLDKKIGSLSNSLTYYWMIGVLHDEKSIGLIPGYGIRNAWKPILVYAKEPIERVGFRDTLWGFEKEKEFHEWGQPKEEAKKLIETFSKEGDTILEPFAGGGSTIQACIETKRNCIAYEIDDHTFELLKKRFPEAEFR